MPEGIMMKKQKSAVKENELIAYAADLLTEAMNDGLVEPLAMIECMQFATKPVLLAAMRTLSPLDEGLQKEIISLALQLSGQSGLASISKKVPSPH